MTQINVDTDFVDGLQLIIDSLMKDDASKTSDKEFEKDGLSDSGYVTLDHTDDLPEADHWCPDAMDWHTSDHESAKAPSVHINVDHHNGDDPYKSENDGEIGKILPLLAAIAPAVGAVGAVGGAVGEAVGQVAETGAEAAQQMSHTDEHKVKDDDVDKEYDQNTNLPPEFGKPEKGKSIAEPFLRKREDGDEDEGIKKQQDIPHEQEGLAMPPTASMPPATMEGGSEPRFAPPTVAKSYDQSFDVLKIWASVDRALPKNEDLLLTDDLSILNSFGLETFTNIEDLVEGTLVHKMLVDRANRPTKEWWESGIKLAEVIEGIDEPAILTAFLYYEPDTFDVRDFQKADPGAGGGETQDVQNVGSASAIDGLGMSADSNVPEDKDCDT